LIDTSQLKYVSIRTTLEKAIKMAKFDKSMQLVLDLVAAQTRLQKRVDQQLFLHGISFTEFTVLRALSLAPENCLRRIDLAQQIGLTASGITRLIAPMEKNNLVSKEANARDARVSLVKLTGTGVQILDDATASFKLAAHAILHNFAQDDLEALATAINRFK
jgi:DNA-binding MarR family transcriptional regulator